MAKITYEKMATFEKSGQKKTKKSKGAKSL